MDEQEFESLLRDALRPVQAPPAMARRIVNRARARSAMRLMAIAAVLILTISGGWFWMERQRKHDEAQNASRQFQIALHITARKLARVNEKLVVEVRIGPKENTQ